MCLDEVTRVAGEVGTEGKLEGQARVANVGGTWKDSTDNVNVMANNVGGHFYKIPYFVIKFDTVDIASANHCCRDDASSIV